MCICVIYPFLVSRIIGQKGKQIQEIIDRSNIAKVRFPSDHETRSILNMSKSEITKNAIIILIGTKQANENACTMMDYLVGSLNEIQAMHKQHRRLDSVSGFSFRYHWIIFPCFLEKLSTWDKIVFSY